ncbi:unnamed protein product [Linum trigynum]|uniref:Fe2OG dioxygenase domain-containing protein n=1 Tax=Linum trigynum TaxID=586398 RepID=A0AAV2DWB9_9ROSI
MGSKTVDAKIPVVNLFGEALKPGSGDWAAACSDVRRAMEGYGCMEVLYDESSEELSSSVLEALEELFELPQEIKMKNVNPKPAHGYMGRLSVLPIHEGLGIEYATDREACEEFTKLMWPEGNPHFCEVVHSYAVMVAQLQKLVVRMLFESYGIGTDKYNAHFDSTTYLLRLLRYRRSKGETNLGFKGHTDKSFVSILHQNQVNGLEVRLNDGEWVYYQPSSPSSFAVVAGDVIMAWSNDRIKSCYHRVMVEGEEVRYAVGLFSFLTAIVIAPEELVDEDHPLMYKPFYNQGLLDFYVKNNSQNKGDTNMVKAYCGTSM